ncbi:hypothetical protein LguiB_028041 [Lonicera macranthoides]
MFTRETDPSTSLELERDVEPYKSKKYDRLHRLASEPLHPSSNGTRHKVMYALMKLNDLKT